MSYEIVVFCATASASQARELLTLARMLLRSAARHDAGVTLTILTDRETEIADPPGDVVRFDVNREQMMLARTEAQTAFVGASNFTRPLLFLDLDILVNRSLEFLLARDFDVALTWRRKSEMPINGGVIMLGNRHPEAGRRFFGRLLDEYRTRYASEAGWWGDQLALAAIVSLPTAHRAEEFTLVRDGISYLVLPAQQYNFSPHSLPATWWVPRSSKYILHFKNAKRKRFMQAYFERHMRDRG